MRWMPSARRTPIGVDVGSCNIKAMQFSRTSRGRRIAAAASFARAVPDSPLDVNELGRLCDVLHRRGFSGTEIVLAVPGEKLLTAVMELPVRASGTSLDAVARTEFARTQKRDANTLEVAYWDVPAPTRTGRATHVMAAACPHADADALVEMFELVGLQVCGLDARSWAMMRGCGPETAGAVGIVAMLEIGSTAAVLVARHHDVVVYQRTLEEASLRRLQDTLVRELKVAPDVAEYVLTEAGLGPENAADSEWEWVGEAKGIISAHLDAMARDLQASISYIGNLYPDAPIDRMLLCGGGAMVPGLPQHLQASLGFEMRVVTPAALADDAAGDTRDCTPALVAAAGLALYPNV